MHKLLPLLVIAAILTIAVPAVVNGIKSNDTSAYGQVMGKSTEAGDNGRGQNLKVQTNTTTSANTSGKKFLGGSIQKLEKVANTTKNSEVKTEITEVIDQTEEAESTIAASLNNMDGRPGFLKFIMGPDYKNAGQVRSEVVHLQNQIRKIDKLEEKTGASESGDLAETKLTLQTELTAIETTLSEKLQGFSLFGWLSKLLSGFVAPTASPTPIGSPDASASASPVASDTPMGSPLGSSTPTAVPTVVPSVMPSATP